jgi:hypothetical protein
MFECTFDPHVSSGTFIHQAVIITVMEAAPVIDHRQIRGYCFDRNIEQFLVISFCFKPELSVEQVLVTHNKMMASREPEIPVGLFIYHTGRIDQGLIKINHS